MLHKNKITSVNEPKIAKDFYVTNYNYKACHATDGPPKIGPPGPSMAAIYGLP